MIFQRIPRNSNVLKNYTKLLLHFNENLTDSGYLNHSATDGSTASETTIKVFGSGARLWNGSATLDYAVQETEFDFDGLFTIESWVRFTSVSGTQSLISRTYFNDDQQGWELRLNNDGYIKFGFAVSGSETIYVTSTTAPSTNTWYHVAVSRDGANAIRLFINGTLEDTETGISTNLTGEDSLGIGCIPDGSHGTRFEHLNKLYGYMDEIRISKGICRYASNFTPSETEFTVD